MCKGPQQKVTSERTSSIQVNKQRQEGREDVRSKEEEIYSWVEPNSAACREHFSNLLFRGSYMNTVLELLLLVLPFCGIYWFGENGLDVQGSMTFKELSVFFIVCAVVRRFYNTYLEAVYFSFPAYRTQPVKEHRLKQKVDLCGRDEEQLALIEIHDQLTMVSQFLLNFGLYFILPGFYPAAIEEEQSYSERFVRLLLNHYVMSFGMYWAHRSLHVVPWLWENIHSFHHWAKHPLSRNTYEDHWLDNFFNAIIGHTYAQILVPLDRPTFWFSHIFRILESLEKHSGVSCGFNLAHSVQQWLPFAQMPHHHDWHHEGFKGSNYTFSSIGGLWDCIFGTRKGGRYTANNSFAATREDLVSKKGTGNAKLPSWFSPLSPLVLLTVLVSLELKKAY